MTFLGEVLLGFLVGAASSLLGLGGGLFLVPLLPWLEGLSQIEAIATSLFTIFFVVSVNTIGFQRQSLIPWKVGLPLAMTAGVFSFLSGHIAQFLPDLILKLILFVVLVTFAMRLWLLYRPQPRSEVSLAQASGAGALSGTLSGLCGIGAGLVLNPLLIRSRWVPPEKIAPTANLVMTLITGCGALAFVKGWPQASGTWGRVHWNSALVIVCVASFLAFFLRRHQGLIRPKLRRKLFIGILFLVAAKVFYQVVALM